MPRASTKRPQNEGLRDKERIFVREYLKDMSGRRAAIAAGYAETSADYTARDMLANPRIQAVIEKHLGARFAKLELEADDVIRELKCLAFVDPAEIVGEDGAPKELQDIRPNVRRAIASVKHQLSADGVTREVKLCDKLGALTTLAKYFGLLQDKLEHSGEVKTVNIAITRVVRGEHS